MKNLLAATEIATLFLDTHLKILRFTPAATRIINLIPGDVGWPVSDIVTNLDYTGLVQDAREVLDTLVVKEVETQTRAGAWYLLRIIPYRTVENVIEVQANDKVLEYLERMQRAAARMQSLVSDLLMYSRFTNGILSFTDVDLNEIILEVLDDFDSLITGSKAQVEVGELPVLSGESTLLRQLFQNLIGNALKFHQPEKAPVVKIESGYLSPQMLQIRVIDQGIGFDERYLHRIFQPFERLHGVSQYDGSGIGLAICRKIVERHSGSITARSEPGKGAVFIVTLPVHQG